MKESFVFLALVAVAACGKDATGTNGPAAVLTATPDTVHFGALAIDLLSAPETLTVTNTGTVAASNIGIVGNGGDQLNFVVTGTDCPRGPSSGAAIQPGNSCRLYIVFEPVSPVGDKRASLGIVADPAGAGVAVVLDGTALAEP